MLADPAPEGAVDLAAPDGVRDGRGALLCRTGGEGVEQGHDLGQVRPAGLVQVAGQALQSGQRVTQDREAVGEGDGLLHVLIVRQFDTSGKGCG